MSLILDALKKSEAERQRQTGPTLLEVRVTQPRRRYPVWVIAVGALLAVNILLLLFFVLRRPAATEPAAAASSTAAGLTAGTPATTAPAPATSATAASAAAAGALPASVAPMVSPMVPAAAELPLAPATGASRDAAAPHSLDYGPALGPDYGPADGSTTGRNPADDEPAVTASDARRFASLPSFSDVGGDLPALRLDLHVYAERPRDRYALINMHRVHEGDVLPEGAKVLAITREGVALDWHGQEFMLHPQ
jgi:general secretion pathway protein B